MTATIASADPALLLQPRWLQRSYETVMVALALTVLALLPVQEPWADTANRWIWAVFVLDYAVRLGTSSQRGRFVRGSLVDLVAILPLDFFRAARALRVLRLLRLARAGSILWRVSTPVRGVLRTNGLGWVLGITVAVITTGALAMVVVEPGMDSFSDALWWSVVTATTVGYGDLSPTTVAGRLVAGVLMLVGIGTIGMLTGSIATYFVRHTTPHHGNPHVAAVCGQLERWHELSAAERRQAAVLLTALADAEE